MTNIRLTYDYTLNSIQVVKDSINQLNTKLTLILTIGLLVFWLIVPKIYLLI
ncbi:hypothetical protein MAN88_11580 [Microcystis aeruginosa]|nr:hypothetical protein MAN88_11580 [Microcystis aeruginosa]